MERSATIRRWDTTSKTVHRGGGEEGLGSGMGKGRLLPALWEDYKEELQWGKGSHWCGARSDKRRGHRLEISTVEKIKGIVAN